jgi:hypothetical protein
VCARDITDTFVTAMYTVHSEHILGTDLCRIEIYADQMCHVNAATNLLHCLCGRRSPGAIVFTSFLFSVSILFIVFGGVWFLFKRIFC